MILRIGTEGWALRLGFGSGMVTRSIAVALAFSAIRLNDTDTSRSQYFYVITFMNVKMEWDANV